MNIAPANPGVSPELTFIPLLKIWILISLTLSVLFAFPVIIFVYWSLYFKSTLYVFLSIKYPFGGFSSLTMYFPIGKSVTSWHTPFSSVVLVATKSPLL